MGQQGGPENAAKGGDSAPAMLPVCISDKAILVAEELRLPNPRLPSRMDSFRLKKKTRNTACIMAAIVLPTLNVLLLLTLFLVAEPVEKTDRRLGMNDSTFWKGRWRKSHIPRKHIFIVDINTPDFPSEKKIQALESCIQTNRNNEIYQITINQYIDQARNVSAFDQLKKKYNNFHFLFQNAPSYFRGSFFEDAINDPPNLMLFKAQLLVLWRYAGMVLSPEWMPLKPLDKLFSKEDKTIVVGTNNGHIGLLSVSNTCNARLFDIMREVKSMKSTSTPVTEAIDRVALKSKNSFRELDSSQVCNNTAINSECYIMQGNLAPRPEPLVAQADNFFNESKANNITVKFRAMPTIVRRFLIFS